MSIQNNSFFIWNLLIPLLFVGLLSSKDANAQWEPTPGPYGASVISISISGTTLVAGTTSNGVFLSTNSGANWSNITGTLPNLYIPSTLITSPYIFVGTNGNGVYRTSNYGTNWSGPGTNITNRNVYSLVRSASGVLYAGTDLGVYRSTNSGIVWLIDTVGLGAKYIYALTILDTNIFAATNGFGIYRKLITGGGSWTPVNTGLPAGMSIYTLSINDTNITSERTVYAGTAGIGVYMSTNRGANWTSLGNLSNYYVYGLYTPARVYMGESSRGIFLTTNNGTNWTAINSGLRVTNIYTLSGSSSSNLFVGMQVGGGIYKSTNSGQNWAASYNGINAANILSLLRTGSYLFAAVQSSGVFVSTNYGINWSERNSGLADIRAQALALAPTDIGYNPVILLGTATGPYYSTDYGVNWLIDTTGMGSKSVNSFYVYDSLILAATLNGVYKRQTDAGIWTAVNNGLTNPNVYSVFGVGSILYAGCYLGGVFRSTNLGANWSVFNTGMSNPIVYVLSYLAGNLYAGTSSGLYLLSGNTWVLVSSGMGQPVVRSLLGSGNNIFAGTSNGVFYSGDGGVSWTAKNDGFTFSTPLITAISLDTASYLYVGTFGRSVWRRNYQNALPVALINFTYFLNENNVTLSWTTGFEVNNLGFEIQRQTILSLGSSDWNTIGFIRGVDNTTNENHYTFVDRNLTSGSYHYRLKQIDFNGNTEFHNLPNTIVIGAPIKNFLEQNYPNPSNSKTKIRFGISRPGKVKLELYDIIGRKVMTIVEKYFEAGYYEIDFGGSFLASGIYYYKMVSENYSQVRKLIFIK